MTQFCIFLAAPRSGTTVLGEAVARAFDATWLQEIFHEDYVDKKGGVDESADAFRQGSFFNFRYRGYRDCPELSFPSPTNQRRLFESYLTYLSRQFGDRPVILDIKYSSWHHLNGYWHFLFDQPGLVQIVRELKLPVVHIIRKNTFLQYCSMKHALKTGVWYSTESRTVARVPLTIDVADCEWFISTMDKTRVLFSGWLQRNIRANVFYETMISNGEFTAEVCESFRELFQADPVGPMQSRQEKVTPPARSIVSNAEEVLKHFANTPYRTMVEEALLPDVSEPTSAEEETPSTAPEES